ncbi:hypothetical protein [Roseateles amylovorans]|uniref:Uncharacterized protein n=1 Tax=Roseateles amylovorans TaxID=2978473 RepID=A0ABY6B1N3_9BURK|nr:hypothetical protein [Roseateles amylovorans]UXH78609.1 hypothetical protein N4261_01320 [Roseateles amylovorans]
MSPLIHKSLTWSIVGTVVLMSAWLADNVQDAHDRSRFRPGFALKDSARPAPTASTLAAALPQAREDRVQVAVKR